jgi:hypothetical protein
MSTPTSSPERKGRASRLFENAGHGGLPSRFVANSPQRTHEPIEPRSDHDEEIPELNRFNKPTVCFHVLARGSLAPCTSLGRIIAQSLEVAADLLS